MFFTENEKKAILWSIAFVLKADGEFAPSESTFFNAEMKTFGITSSQFSSYINRLNKSEWVRTIQSLSHEKTEYMVSRWLAAIKADGKIKREEIDFTGYMASELGIDLSKYINAAIR